MQPEQHDFLNIIRLFSLAIISILLAACSTSRVVTPPSSPTRFSPSASPTKNPLPTTLPPFTQVPTRLELSPTLEATFGKGSISEVQVSPNGKIAAVEMMDGFHWYDAQTFAELGYLDAGDLYVGAIHFSPNSRFAVVEAIMGAAVVDLSVAKVIAYAQSGGAGSAHDFVFSPDSHYLAFLSADATTGGSYHQIKVIDTLTGMVYGEADQNGIHAYPTRAENRHHWMSPPAISPDSQLVAAGHSDGRVYVWDIASGKTRFILEGHSDFVTGVDFSPDGTTLASSSDDGTIRLWSVGTGRLVRVIAGFLDATSSVRYSPEGTHLTVTVQDHPARFVDLVSDVMSDPAAPPVEIPSPFADELHRQGYLDFAPYANALAFRADGAEVAIAMGSIAIYDVRSRDLGATIVPPRQGMILQLAYSADGSRLAAISTTNDVYIWDLASRVLIFDIRGEILLAGQSAYLPGYETGYYDKVDEIRGIIFSPDGSRLAIGNGPTIEVWDISTGSKEYSLQQVSPPTSSGQISFSSDGSRIYATLDGDRRAAVWEAATGKLIQEVPLPVSEPNSYQQANLHGATMARSNPDVPGCWIELWNLDQAKMTCLESPENQFRMLSLSADGVLLFGISSDARLIVWNTTTGGYITATGDLINGQVSAISPDNHTLAAVQEDGRLTLWNIPDVAGIVAQITPRATATPGVGGKTPIPAAITPTAMATPLSIPTGQATPAPGAITSSTRYLVVQLSQFGEGTIERLSWSADGMNVQIAGSTGLHQYAVADANRSLSLSHANLPNLWTYSTATTPDGHTLAAGISGGHVQVWDMTSSIILVDLEGSGQPALSPDGTNLAYLAPDGPEGTLTIYDLTSHERRAALQDANGTPQWPVFSPDGKLVAAVHPRDNSRCYHAAVRVWDAATGEIVSAPGGPDVDITDLSFSPDGQYLVAAAGGSAWVWDVQPGTTPFTLNLYPLSVPQFSPNLNVYVKSVTAAAISPDDETLAVGTSENTILLYNPTNGAFLRKLVGLSNAPHRMTFNPSGSLLVVADGDGDLTLWNVTNGQQLSRLTGHTGSIGGLAFRTDGNLAVWEGGTAWTIQPSTGEVLHTTRISMGKIYAASPTGDRLAVYSPFQMSLWDAVTGQFRQTLEGEAEETFLDYFYEGDGLRQFYGAIFNADGTRLVTYAMGGVWFYDARDGILLQKMPGTLTKKAALTADGTWLLYSWHDMASALQLLNLQTGADIPDLQVAGSGIPPASEYTQYAFSADDRLAGALYGIWSEAPQLILWDPTTGQQVGSMPFAKETRFTSLALSPDHLVAAVGLQDGSIQLVDLQHMQVFSTLIGQHGSIQTLAFSIDGNFLASAAEDGTVRVWKSIRKYP
jgi:WD40 repeat protein